MTDRDPASGTQVRKDREKWTLGDRLEDHLAGCAPADMFKGFADVGSLCG